MYSYTTCMNEFWSYNCLFYTVPYVEFLFHISSSLQLVSYCPSCYLLTETQRLY